MRITEALAVEHQALYPLLNSIEAAGEKASLDQMKGQAERLYRAIKSHGDIEHDLLFNDFQGKPPEHQGPVAAMRNEHAAIEDALLRIRNIQDAERARLLLYHAVQITRDHMVREEQIYFKRARQVLGDARLEELGGEYARRRAAKANPAGDRKS